MKAEQYIDAEEPLLFPLFEAVKEWLYWTNGISAFGNAITLQGPPGIPHPSVAKQTQERHQKQAPKAQEQPQQQQQQQPAQATNPEQQKQPSQQPTPQPQPQPQLQPQLLPQPQPHLRAQPRPQPRPQPQLRSQPQPQPTSIILTYQERQALEKKEEKRHKLSKQIMDARRDIHHTQRWLQRIKTLYQDTNDVTAAIGDNNGSVEEERNQLFALLCEFGAFLGEYKSMRIYPWLLDVIRQQRVLNKLRTEHFDLFLQHGDDFKLHIKPQHATKVKEEGESAAQNSAQQAPPNGESDSTNNNGFRRSEITSKYGEPIVEAIENAYGYESIHFTYSRKGLHKVPNMLLSLLRDQLQELNLSHNNLVRIPPAVATLVNLRKLYFFRNNIASFPPELASLSKLRVLNLSYNKIKTLPPQVEQMTSLEILELDHNMLLGLPPQVPLLDSALLLPCSFCSQTKNKQMEEMCSLEKLYLQFNKLRQVPPEVGFIPKLYILHLENNPIKSLPPDVYQKGTEAVKEFLRSFVPEPETGHDLQHFAFSPDFADLTINLNEGLARFPAHKVVLSARSPKLRELLMAEERDEKKKEEENGGDRMELPLAYGKVKVFKAFLAYLYNDSEDIPKLEVIAKDLAELAKLFAVPRLEQICRRVNEHYITVPPSTFIKDFAAALEPPVLHTDVTFEVEDESFPAHKLFLAASSAYFKGMFLSGLKEAQERVVPLPSLRKEVFMAIREYCYTGDVEEITGEIAIDLLAAANAFSLPRLKAIVEGLLGYSIDMENACCLYEVACLYETSALRRACLLFILQNYAKVRWTEAWKDLSEALKEQVVAKAKKWNFKI
ncbi:zf-piccolo domain-containing protein, variant 2 [Balamuthia mandrillaris]